MTLSYTQRYWLAQAAITADGKACGTCGTARPDPDAEGQWFEPHPEGWQWDEIDAMDDSRDTVIIWTCPDCLGGPASQQAHAAWEKFVTERDRED